MTLAECIAIYHERTNVTPISRPTTVLTPLGHADVAVRRAVDAIRVLEPQDRAVLLLTFTQAVRDAIDDTRPPATA